MAKQNSEVIKPEETLTAIITKEANCGRELYVPYRGLSGETLR